MPLDDNTIKRYTDHSVDDLDTRREEDTKRGDDQDSEEGMQLGRLPLEIMLLDVNGRITRGVIRGGIRWEGMGIHRRRRNELRR